MVGLTFQTWCKLDEVIQQRESGNELDLQFHLEIRENEENGG